MRPYGGLGRLKAKSQCGNTDCFADFLVVSTAYFKGLERCAACGLVMKPLRWGGGRCIYLPPMHTITEENNTG